jgi:peptidoglycan hydrolase-like protein with peptidoglycan-binding domain
MKEQLTQMLDLNTYQREGESTRVARTSTGINIGGALALTAILAAAGCAVESGSQGTHDYQQVVDEETSLQKLGYYKGKIDGIAGPALERAVKRFQKKHHLDDDGVYGPVTRGAVGDELAREKKI